MTYEQKFNFMLSAPKFRSEINFLKVKWGFGQKRYQSIENLIRDERKLYQKPKARSAFYKKEKLWPYRLANPFGAPIKLTNDHFVEFLDDITIVLDKFNLPKRCGDMILDFMMNGKIKDAYARVSLRSKTNIHQRKQTGVIEMLIAPDATIRDVKKIWPTVMHRQKLWNHGDKKTQKIKKVVLAEKIIPPALAGRKPDNMELQKIIIGDAFHKGSFDDVKKFGAKARNLARSYKSKHLKTLKRHLG